MSDAGSPTPNTRVRFALGLMVAALVGVYVLWIGKVLPRRSGLGHIVGSVAALDGLRTPLAAQLWAGFAVITAAAAMMRRPTLARVPTVSSVGVLALASGLIAFVSPVGHHAGIVGLALIAGTLAAALWPSALRADPGRVDRWLVIGLWAGLAAVHMIYSMNRHWWFGSGSWDHGCMVHNFYLSSRFLPTTSTVLGDVDFLGDHFMIGIYLYAPIVWVWSSGFAVLAIQSVNLACVGPAVYLIARHHRAPVGPSLALATAAGLSFGMQSAGYFDSHEITVGFGFLAWGVWAFETGRLRLATGLLAIFMLFKESLGAYVVALGLLAVWRGLRGGPDRRALGYGIGWVIGGAVWFVLVNRVFMPALIARANAPEAHETFVDFGPTVFQALIGIVTQPLKAFGALFVPGDKLWSHVTTLSGYGWLSLLAPQVGVAALPLVAERFLSSKATMWQMGYHYAAPLSLYAGWAAARGYPRAIRLIRAVLQPLGGDSVAAGAPAFFVVYILVAAGLTNEFGYKHPANYHRWRADYFSMPDRRASNAAAVRFVLEQGRSAKLAVQNRILPHLADRRYVYRLGEWSRADWVVLSVGESAWPWGDRYPLRIARQLGRDPTWRLVFSQGGTAVFARASVTSLPSVPPTPELGLSRLRPAATRLDESSTSR